MVGLVVVLAVLMALPTVAHGEILSNTSFETADGLFPADWGFWNASWSWGGYGYTYYEQNDAPDTWKPALEYPALDGDDCVRLVGVEYTLTTQNSGLSSHGLVVGNTYYWGFWARDILQGGSAVGVSPFLRFYDTFDASDSLDADINIPQNIPADGNWHYVEQEFTIPTGTLILNTSAWMNGDYDYWIGGDYLIDKVYLGATPNEWSFASVPVPAIDSIATLSGPQTLTDLSWTDAADMLSCDVYLKVDDGDPNVPIFDAGDLIATGVTTGTVNLASAGVTLTNNTPYVWRVDSTSGTGTTQGYLWWFETGDAPPVVDAGADQYEGLDPTVATVSLNGSVIDDGTSPVITLWTVDDPNNVTITNPTATVTTATINAAATRIFTLTATDAVSSRADAMTANVYATPCEAAYADPAGIPAKYPNGSGDIDGDCDTDLDDFALFAASWLDCFDARLGCTP
jgi:hypothetical protein